MDNVITSMVRPGMSHSAALSAIKDAGARFIGSGYSTKAYGYRIRLAKHDPVPVMRVMDPAVAYAPIKIEIIDEERVLRVSRMEYGIRLTIECAMMEPDDPFAPKVYGYVELSDGCFACEMELLTDRYGSGYHDDNLWGVGAGKFGKARPKPALFEVSPFMRRIERLRHTIAAEYDLHSGNVLWRSSPKHPVILDPIISGL